VGCRHFVGHDYIFYSVEGSHSSLD
jgi:hypothetical protein